MVTHGSILLLFFSYSFKVLELDCVLQKTGSILRQATASLMGLVIDRV